MTENMTNKRYSAREVDIAYLTGVFNVSGLDGLQQEIDRLKMLKKNPHEIIVAEQQDVETTDLQSKIIDVDHLFHLHVCEQEGLLHEDESPFSAKDWYEGFIQAEQAWKEIKEILNQKIKK